MSLAESKQILAMQAAVRAKGITEPYKKKLPYLAEDIESVAKLGAVRAASTYDERGGESWERWSNKLIKGSVVSFVKKECLRESYRIRFKDLKQQSWDQREEPSGTDEVDGKVVLALIETLEGRERTVCEMVYKQGKKLKDAATLMGVSGAAATLLHQRALARLRFALPD